MKRVLFIFMFLLIPLASAACNLDASLLNQDPEPGVPGSYVEVVFQLDGTENSDCEGAYFEVVPQFPFSLDEGESVSDEISGDTFIRDYKKTWNIPYKLRINPTALDEDYEIKVKYSSGKKGALITEKFNISIDDVEVDFEVFVKDYDPQTKEITLEILNIGDNDVEAVTLTVPKQENLKINGARNNIIGDLDSNEYTTAEFTGIPSDGEINLSIRYTDEIGERRETSGKVYFDSGDFKTTIEESFPWLSTTIVLAIILIIVYWVYKKRKKKK